MVHILSFQLHPETHHVIGIPRHRPSRQHVPAVAYADRDDDENGDESAKTSAWIGRQANLAALDRMKSIAVPRATVDNSAPPI